MYLLDANVLITAHNNYYAIDQVPEYWGWLVDQAGRSSIKMPIEIIEEVKAGHKEEVKNGKTQKELLYDWIEKHDQEILLDEQVDSSLVRRVVAEGYANNLTDEQVDSLGRDPFLIAYAMADSEQRCVVTTEVSKPSRTRHNRKIPDVCKSLDVQCKSPFFVNRKLGFHTGWRQT